jgi:predicted RNase H-like nuclease (RuvC/YqgF family)
MCNEDAYELIEFLPDDVYYEVYYRRHELPPEVQAYYQDNPTKSLKLKVRNYSEKEWEKDQSDKYEARMKYMKDFKKNYIAPPRPREPIDYKIETLKSQLESNKADLTDMMRGANYKKKYTNSEDDDPMIREVQVKIRQLENELECIEPEADILNRQWTDLSALDAMLENVGSFFGAKR